MVRTRWNTVTFGDVSELEQGLAFNKHTNHLMAERGIPLLRITDLIHNTQTKFVDERNVPRKFISNTSDIIYTRTGQVGLVFTGKIGVVHNNCFRVIPKEGIERDYMYWYLRRPTIKDFARTLATGAAQPDLSHSAFKTIPFSYPDRPIQRRIADILSAYDELIENNTRRMKLLEEMAQTIYREWFVHFRFPGHENVNMADSPLGKIPEGWEVVKLGDVADIQWGDTSTTKASYVEDGFNAYSASGLDGKLDHYDFDKPGVVLSAIGARCGLTWYARGKWSCIKNTIRFWAKTEKASTEFLFYATQGPGFWQRRGAAQPFISQGDALQLQIVCPERQWLGAFTVFARNELDLIGVLEAKNTDLRRTRDLLLPKLISGEVDVSTHTWRTKRTRRIRREKAD